GLVRRIGDITAREVAVTGLDWTFAPTIAVARNMRWGRAYESYAETPEIVSTLGAALIEGLQGDFGPHNIIATAKHFIADGGTQNGVDQGDAIVGEDELLALHAPGYFAAIEAGVQSIMISYSSWNGVKMHAQRGLITDVLKNRMGFDGIVLSDWDAIAQVKGCSGWDCPQAVNAGIDMFMVPYRIYWKKFIDTTRAYVKDGVIPEARIDDAVTRILRVKMRAGIFDKPRPSQRPLSNRLDQFGSEEHRAVAREAVRKSLVLLKNSNNVLPLDRNARILVTGEGAHNFPNQTGGWSIDWQATKVDHEDFKGATSIWEGIKQAAPNAVYSPDGSLLEAGADGKKFDAAIVVIAEQPYAESRGDIAGFTLAHAFHYPESFRLLKRVAETGMPVVTVMLSGRPLYVNPELNLSDAFVAAWLPGSEGAGVADVLLRNEQGQIAYDFTGKLPVSWPKSHCQEPVNVDDPEYAPLFTAGYGLRYGSKDMLGDDLPEGFDDVRCY
ncbi:MAG TPA: glycoside hydrolase family 3 protein, partial [Gammaproteobacteria bacterium]